MTIKEKMLKQLAEAQAEEKALRAAVIDGETKEARMSADEALTKVLEKIAEINEIIAELDAPADPAPADGEGERKITKISETRGAVKPMENIEMNKRLAFANYVTRGIQIPVELRADAITNTTNAATAIPENLLNQIIEKIDAVGMVLPLVTRTAYPVGQSIAVDSAKPTATFVAEGASTDSQAKSTLGSIVFGAFKLRCEIRMTQEVTAQTIAAFEALFVKQVSEAMVKAIEGKIISADDGSDCPTGILYAANGVTDKTVEIAKLATGHITYAKLCEAEAALPQQYEAGAKWFMSKKTFMQFAAMVDSNGQPIGRVNYGIGGKPERMLLGRDVVLTGEYLADYTEATALEDACFAFLFDPSDYCLNTSYDLGIKSKEDWDTEDKCIKAVMSVDGKVLSRESLVKMVKKYN